jgi:colanic acid/amylovoran biosynthesis protein
MRYHPNIFAAKMNIPSIAIYYEHKTKAFMKELGRLDLTINIEKINAQIIIDKFLYLEKNYDTIKRQITEKNPHLKEKSKKTTKLIINDLHKSKIDFQKSYN